MQFKNLTFDPLHVIFKFSPNQTAPNCRKKLPPRQQGRFVCNLTTWDLREAVNATAEQIPPDMDDFDQTGSTGVEKGFTALHDPQLPM